MLSADNDCKEFGPVSGPTQCWNWISRSKLFTYNWCSGSEVIKFFMFNSSEHEIQLHIKSKMLKNKDVSCFQSLRCCIYHANKCSNANNDDKFHVQLSMKKSFITSGLKTTKHVFSQMSHFLFSTLWYEITSFIFVEKSNYSPWANTNFLNKNFCVILILKYEPPRKRTCLHGLWLGKNQPACWATETR